MDTSMGRRSFSFGSVRWSAIAALCLGVLVSRSNGSMSVRRDTNLHADEAFGGVPEDLMAKADAHDVRTDAHRRLQADWCVRDGEDVYCCGFGAQASCISRGFEYIGADTPCEVRITTDGNSTQCEGLGGESGFLEDCPCEVTDAPVTPAPSETTVAPAGTPLPAATASPGSTPSPVSTEMPNMMTPSPESTEMPSMTPSPESTDMPSMTPSPESTDMPSMTPSPESTDMPSMTPSPTSADMPSMMPSLETPAPTTSSRDFLFTQAPTMMPLESTAAPSSSLITLMPTSGPTMSSAAPTMTMTNVPSMAPTMSTGMPTMAPTMTPTASPSESSRGITLFSSAPSAAPTSSTPVPSQAPTPQTTSGVSGTFGGGVYLAVSCVVAIGLARFLTPV